VLRHPTGAPEPAEATEPSEELREPLQEPGEPSKPGEASKPAEPPEPPEHRGVLSFLRELPVLILLAIALAILLKTFVVQAFYIPSGSMEPALEPGDRVLVNKAFYEPSRFDIIVFADPKDGTSSDRGVVDGFLHWLSEGIGFARPEHEDFIKRVIGLPGEVIEIRRHIVTVNGRELREPYLTEEARASMSDFGPVTVPEGALFMMGDNRGNSNDSRAGLGFVPVDKVIGRAFVLIWPPSRAGWVH
jgi:signal peptidase I